jgi:hypothetical protein
VSLAKAQARALADKRFSGGRIGFMYATARVLRYFVYKESESL